MKCKKTLFLSSLFVVVSSFLVVLGGCDNYVLSDVLENMGQAEAAAFPLTLAPSEATISANSDFTFVASGGVPPYTFDVTSGGGTIDPDGLYSAPPSPGTATIEVSDDLGDTSEATVTVTSSGVLGLSPSTVTLVTNGTLTFAATGGKAPYTFSVEAGGGSIDPDTGEYTAPSTSGSATVRVTDSSSPQGSAEADVTITPVAPFSISPSSIALGVNHSADFEAFGGVPPYTFSIPSAVPEDGTIDPGTGYYVAPDSVPSPGDAHLVTVRVTDSDSPAATMDATVEVYAPFTISPTSRTLPVDHTFTFSASGGKSPYTFEVVEADGGTIDPDTGEYTAPATPPSPAGEATVRVTDDLGNASEASVTVTDPQPLAITPTSRTLLADDVFTFGASGGMPPYTFSLVPTASGSIDPATGEYTAPSSAGSDVVRVTDDTGDTSDATVEVVLSGPLTITPDAPTVPVNGQETFSASGGTPPYVFSIVGTGGGSINASTGVYQAPATNDTVTVRVTDSDNDNADTIVTVAGSQCGLSNAESEPNDERNKPWTDTDDFGIELLPGCSTTITGTTDSDTKPDVFKFNTGSADFVGFMATWNSGDDELNFRIYRANGDEVAKSESVDADSESFLWAVEAASTDYYIELEVKDKGGEPYTLTIAGN